MTRHKRPSLEGFDDERLELAGAAIQAVLASTRRASDGQSDYFVAMAAMTAIWALGVDKEVIFATPFYRSLAPQVRKHFRQLVLDVYAANDSPGDRDERGNECHQLLISPFIRVTNKQGASRMAQITTVSVSEEDASFTLEISPADAMANVTSDTLSGLTATSDNESVVTAAIVAGGVSALLTGTVVGPTGSANVTISGTDSEGASLSLTIPVSVTAGPTTELVASNLVVTPRPTTGGTSSTPATDPAATSAATPTEAAPPAASTEAAPAAPTPTPETSQPSTAPAAPADSASPSPTPGTDPSATASAGGGSPTADPSASASPASSDPSSAAGPTPPTA